MLRYYPHKPRLVRHEPSGHYVAETLLIVETGVSSHRPTLFVFIISLLQHKNKHNKIKKRTNVVRLVIYLRLAAASASNCSIEMPPVALAEACGLAWAGLEAGTLVARLASSSQVALALATAASVCSLTSLSQ